MAEEKASGSIILEILIVILAAALIGSIIYPKKLKEQEEKDVQLSRQRMSDLFNAELVYQRFNDVYTDSLDQLINFVRSSPQYEGYVDSVIIQNLDSVITRLDEFKATEQTILSNIAPSMDSTLIDSMATLQQNVKLDTRQLGGIVEFVLERMKNMPVMPVDDLKQAYLQLDSKQFTLDMDIAANLMRSGDFKGAKESVSKVIGKIENVTDKLQKVINKVPEYKGPQLDSLQYSPITHQPFRLVYVDTSAIKYLNIYSPLDSADIEKSKKDFLKYYVGGLRLQNPGHITEGKKSWEENSR